MLKFDTILTWADSIYVQRIIIQKQPLRGILLAVQFFSNMPLIVIHVKKFKFSKVADLSSANLL